MPGRMSSIVAAVSILTLCVGALLSSPAKADGVTEAAEVTFVSSMTVADAKTWILGKGVDPLDFVATYSGSPDTVTTGYLYDPSSTADIADDYKAEVSDMLVDVSAQLSANAAPDPSVTQQLDQLSAIRSDLEAGNSSITSAKVEGDPIAVEALQNDPSVASVTTENQVEADRLSNPDPGDTPSCAGAYWPSSAALVAGASTRGTRRFMYQHGFWNSTRLANLKCYNHVTYEPDFVLNNTDGHRYMGAPTAWGSNMPSDYLDPILPRWDDPARPTYTVGTSHASLLNANWPYWGTIRARLGNASTDTASYAAQRGHRWPSWCYSWLCVQPDASHFLILEWYFAVPGTWNWNP